MQRTDRDVQTLLSAVYVQAFFCALPAETVLIQLGW